MRAVVRRKQCWKNECSLGEGGNLTMVTTIEQSLVDGVCVPCVFIQSVMQLGKSASTAEKKREKSFHFKRLLPFAHHQQRGGSAGRPGRGEGADKVLAISHQHCLFCAHFISPPLLFFLISSNLVGREFLNAHTRERWLTHRVRAGTENTRFENIIITRRAERNKKKTRRFKNETKKTRKYENFN